MALDEDERQLETIKLCVDYLKHLTTLSGVATVVVLTLTEGSGKNAQPLFFPAFFFGVATVMCLVGILYLISGFAFGFLGKPAAGVMFVGSVAMTFTVALIGLLMRAFPLSDMARLLIQGGLVLLALMGTYFLIKYASDASQDS